MIISGGGRPSQMQLAGEGGQPSSSSVYRVTQTVIDGKKTLILDQRDIQRIINTNATNGNTCSVVLQPPVSYTALLLTPVLGAWTKVSKNQLNLFLRTFTATPEISLLIINL